MPISGIVWRMVVVTTQRTTSSPAPMPDGGAQSADEQPLGRLEHHHPPQGQAEGEERGPLRARSSALMLVAL